MYGIYLYWRALALREDRNLIKVGRSRRKGEGLQLSS